MILVYTITNNSRNSIEGYDSTRLNSKNQTLYSQENYYYWTPYYGYKPNLSYTNVWRHPWYPHFYPYRYIPDVHYVTYPHNTL